jgi:transposase
MVSTSKQSSPVVPCTEEIDVQRLDDVVSVVTLSSSMLSPSAAPAFKQLTSFEEAIAALQLEREKVAELTRERDQLRASHERLRLELELLKRRIFIAKAERVDTRQLEMEFAATLAELDRLAGTTPETLRSEESDSKKAGPSKAPTGRRDLRELALEEERVEIADPVFERLVAEGKAERFGFEESCKLAFKRGGYRRLVMARVKYRVIDGNGESQIETTEMPPECFERSLAAPSALAHVATDKLCDGLPLNRIEDRATREGIELDRGTMSRWLEDAGGTAGATVVAAMKEEALATAFCIATDATGVRIQPEARADGARQPCRKGHYFVLIADRDHVLFEYTAKESSAFVAEMFRGYQGYIQADAKNVYDVLFRQPKKPPDPAKKEEVGCWSHCRRGFWEAAVSLKSEVAREGVARISRIFELDDAWRSRRPDEIHRLRNEHLRPHLDAFFAWAEAEHAKVRDERGMLRSALGYAVRQKDALRRVLDDGRLVLENNRSERALRKVAMGRKAWLFVGSDGHAQSAANLLSLIASARLHQIEPEGYLRDLFRVLPHWPRDRYLELAPKYWLQTRSRLDHRELLLELGPLTVPPPLTGMPIEQSTTD